VYRACRLSDPVSFLAQTLSRPSVRPLPSPRGCLGGSFFLVFYFALCIPFHPPSGFPRTAPLCFSSTLHAVRPTLSLPGVRHPPPVQARKLTASPFAPPFPATVHIVLTLVAFVPWIDEVDAFTTWRSPVPFFGHLPFKRPSPNIFVFGRFPALKTIAFEDGFFLCPPFSTRFLHSHHRRLSFFL